MKSFLAIALVVVVCAISTGAEEVCHAQVTKACQPGSLLQGGTVCNSRYGGIEHVEPELQAYINDELTKSYEYLLLATHFNSYQKNRPGFQKLYQELSDRSFDNTIDLIKQVTRRGGVVDFNYKTSDVHATHETFDVDELHSLALALDNEKHLARRAINVHLHALNSNLANHDPEVAHYMEEKFLPKQAETVRKLSGYTNDLAKIMNGNEPSLGVYMFDEYLQKQ